MSSGRLELIKYIAIISMFIDHFAILYLGQIEGSLLRGIGRLAFPLLGFVLVYNYLYNTSNKVNYIKRLFLFALISQPFYYIAFEGILNPYTLNIFFTLSISLLIIYLNEIYKGNKIMLNLLIAILVIPVSIFLDYFTLGIIFILSVYIFLKKRTIFNFSIMFFLIYLLNVYWNPIYSLFGLVSVLLIIAIYYSKIEVKRMNKYVFYLFYPLHLVFFKFI